MIRSPFKRMASAFIALLLVSSFVMAPVSKTLTIQKADAAVATTAGQMLQLVEEAGTFISTAASAISDKMTAWGMGSLNMKEFTFDTIAWALVNLTLQSMIRSTTQWVASGFQGSPAFVTDLNGFLMNIADQVAGDFIWNNTTLGFLCSPFKLNIRLALDMQYNQGRNYKSQCTLSGMVNNIDNFLAGDFYEGGWDGWYNVALNPTNNPYDQLYNSNLALSATLSNARGEQVQLLNFGKGFMSKKECKTVEDESGGHQKCSIVTPGSTIQDQITSTLNIPADRLKIADELNELIGALFAQLANQALSGARGLLGLSDSSNGDGNYFDRMAAEQTPASYDSSEATGSSNTTIQNSITSEEEYLEYNAQIISLITDAQGYKDEVYGEDNTCSTGNLTSSLSQQLSSARRTASSTEIIIEKLDIWLYDYTLTTNTSISASVLNELYAEYGASSVPGVQSEIMNRYLSYTTSGVLHDASELVGLKIGTLREVTTQVSAFTQAIDEDCEDNNSGGG